MRRIARLVLMFSIALAGAVQQAKAASGYDLGDMWWDPQESGWGVQLVQQRDVIVATIYVYGTDGRPAWYTAALAFQGLAAQTHEMSYSGDLYAATGSWFGASPFSLSSVRKVGTMTVVAPTMSTATLTYSVDGAQVTKAIRRYTFRWDDYDGSYSGAHNVTATRCNDPADNVTRTAHTTYTFTRVGSQMTVVAADGARTCTYTGAYSQDGRLGRLDSTYACNTGEVGAMALEEMNVQRFGLVGRLFGANNRGCHLEGTFAAARQ